MICVMFAMSILASRNTDTRAEGKTRATRMSLYPYHHQQPAKHDSPQQKAVKDFEALWVSPTRVGGLDDALRKEIPYTSPNGDTFFMRHRNGFGNMVEELAEVRRRFQLAQVLNRYDEVRDMLRSILTLAGDNTLVRYRVFLGISMAAFRLEVDAGEGSKFARMALEVTPQEEPWKADAYFLLGIAARNEGRFDEALRMCQRAVELDGFFLQAHIATAELSANMLAKERLGTAAKLNETALLLKTLETIVDLIDNRKDFFALGERLTALARASGEVSFAAGYCFFHSREAPRARLYLGRAISDAALPVEIREKARELLSKLPTVDTTAGK